MCKLLQNLNPFKSIKIFLIMIFVITLLIIFCTWYCSIPPKLYNATQETEAWFYFLSGSGTAALAIIAWLKASQFHDQNEGNFLLHIDERWGSP